MTTLRHERSVLLAHRVGRGNMHRESLGYDREPWMSDASCRGVGVEPFFPERNQLTGHIKVSQYHEARQICMNCPVRIECLEYALKENLTGGMFGGLTPRQRHNLAQRRDAGDDAS